jgi:hypothetical protein
MRCSGAFSCTIFSHARQANFERCVTIAVLGRNHVQRLARLLADHVHRRAAAWAIGVWRRHRLVDARQMLGQCAGLACPRTRQPRLFLLLGGRLGLRERCFDVFEGELELVGRQPFEPFVPRAKAMIVRLAKKMMHMLVEALQPVALCHKLHFLGPLRVAFGNRNVALGDGFAGQRAQALNIVRKRISRRAHTRSKTVFARECDALLEDDSIDTERRSLHRLWSRHPWRMHAAPIEPFKRAQLRRRQSHHAVGDARPAELAFLQALGKRQRPVPSQNTSFSRSARFERKQ